MTFLRWSSNAYQKKIICFFLSQWIWLQSNCELFELDLSEEREWTLPFRRFSLQHNAYRIFWLSLDLIHCYWIENNAQSITTNFGSAHTGEPLNLWWLLWIILLLSPHERCFHFNTIPIFDANKMKTHILWKSISHGTDNDAIAMNCAESDGGHNQLIQFNAPLYHRTIQHLFSENQQPSIGNRMLTEWERAFYTFDNF